MKKTILKQKTKKTVKEAPVVNHLQPIEGLLVSIRTAEVKLQDLLNAIPKKLEKFATKAKTKLSKALEQHKKAQIKHHKLEAKHKAKPSKLTKAAVKKAELLLTGAASVVTAIKNEHAKIQSQMATCKEMKKAVKTTEKPMAKKATTKRAKKVSTKKQNATGAEQSDVYV